MTLRDTTTNRRKRKFVSLPFHISCLCHRQSKVVFTLNTRDCVYVSFSLILRLCLALPTSFTLSLACSVSISHDFPSPSPWDFCNIIACVHTGRNHSVASENENWREWEWESERKKTGNHARERQGERGEKWKRSGERDRDGESKRKKHVHTQGLIHTQSRKL